MKISRASGANVKIASEILAAGGLVISPTDSVYGLFCNALDEDAVNRVKGVKGRDSGKPFQVAVRKEDAEDYGVINPSARRIIEHFWPGDVNVIVKKKPLIPDFVSAGTICLTCHGNPVARKLVELSRKPLVSTSANFSGEPAPSTSEELDASLLELVDMILDGGHTKNRRPNTIVDLTQKTARIVREGPVGKRDLEDLIPLQCISP
ncbi:MAG: L-threonylcarbamoyladenylate synthase [Candidatus Altiarchaeota archaeon]|nr:L-threonylcarbamoyladenylate synthase [Candidatus Altiarchaeota archaeon]